MLDFDWSVFQALCPIGIYDSFLCDLKMLHMLRLQRLKSIQ